MLPSCYLSKPFHILVLEFNPPMRFCQYTKKEAFKPRIKNTLKTPLPAIMSFNPFEAKTTPFHIYLKNRIQVVNGSNPSAPRLNNEPKTALIILSSTAYAIIRIYEDPGY